MNWLSAPQIKGRYVTLEPLSIEHIDELKEAVLDGEPWKLWYANVPSPELMNGYVDEAIKESQKGNIAFSVRCNKTNKIVGTTRFYNVDAKNKRAMLGYTWYSSSLTKTLEKP